MSVREIPQWISGDNDLKIIIIIVLVIHLRRLPAVYFMHHDILFPTPTHNNFCKACLSQLISIY